VAAHDENVLGVDLAQARQPLPEFGNVLRHQRHDIKTDDRDPASPIVDQEDPAP
jgi:hypothetical protein